MSAPAPGRRPRNRGPRRPRYRRRAPGHQLTDRDVEIIRWMTRHGVVTADDVAIKFFWREEQGRPGIWAAYRRLTALYWMGLIIRDKPFVALPTALRVTTAGARLADVGVGPATLVLSQLAHSLALVRLDEELLKEHPDGELDTERELRAENARRKRAGEEGWGRIPDARLRLPKKGVKGEMETITIELDLSRKDRREIERIITAYDYERDIDRIWWYVTPERVERYRDIVRAMHGERRIEIREWRG